MEISEENLYLDMIEALRVNHALLERRFTPSMQTETN